MAINLKQHSKKILTDGYTDGQTLHIVCTAYNITARHFHDVQQNRTRTVLSEQIPYPVATTPSKPANLPNYGMINGDYTKEQ